MSLPEEAEKQAATFTCRVLTPARRPPSLAEDARAGLLARPRSLPPKYFYDARGSELFDAICATPEYYPTRREDELLAAHAGAIVSTARPDHILELGSGASRKTHHLLAACEALGQPCVYWPFDVCESIVREAAERLIAAYPWLEVNALIGDYLGGLAQLPAIDGRRLFAFLGSTIGNFEPELAVGFLRELRACMREEDFLLLGADRAKDPAILRAAYNDASGATTAFNLNLLRVLNRELEADFDPAAFEHRAVYNDELMRMEMHLRALRAQTVRLGALSEAIELDAGETILTEISRKFTPQGLEALLAAAGLALHTHFEPTDGHFSLLLARVR